MQKYVFHTDGFGIAAGVWIDPHVKDGTELYVASEVDALVAELKSGYETSMRESGEVIEDRNRRIADLEKALREAMGWNWLDEDNPPPKEIVDQCSKVLMER